MDALIITLIAVAAVNAIGTATTAVASIFWNRSIREAKGIQIRTLQGQLEDAKEMNDVRFREVLTVQKEVLQGHIDQIQPQLKQAKGDLQKAEEKVTSLEKAAAERQAGMEELGVLVEEFKTELEGARRELNEALYTVKDLDEEQAEAHQDMYAVERISSFWARFSNVAVPSLKMAPDPRYIPQAPEDFSHLDNYPDREGESPSEAGDQQS